jgi:dipeptidase E
MHLRLALYSEPEASANRPMDERMVGLLTVAQPRIGYVAASPDPQRFWFSRLQQHYQSLGARFDLYVDETHDDFREASAQLCDCDAIYLSGGNTFHFLAWLRQTPLLAALHRYATHGGMLIGVSAGAILMTPTVATAVLCGDERDAANPDERAMGLVRFGFWPHYQLGQERELRNAMAEDFSWPLYACPDGAGVIVNGTQIERHGPVVAFERERAGLCPWPLEPI